VLELLDGNFTFVNERLAKEYGIPNIYGPHFRRVTLPPSLEHAARPARKGALMTVTSNAARTSPVTRGKWFLQTFLGVSPPDPPPDVPAFVERAADTTGNTKPPTMRQALEKHRISPTCSSCHQIFEPMGLCARELRRGRQWRTLDEGQPIDASGVLPRRHQGERRRRSAQVARPLLDAVSVQVVDEKLLMYATGRAPSIETCLVRAISRDAAAGGSQVSRRSSWHREERLVPDEPEVGGAEAAYSERISVIEPRGDSCS
jgi:hypothetical protein